MKVKTKISTLTLGLVLAAGALIGCNQGGGNPPAPAPKFYVEVTNKDNAKFEVSEFDAEGYEAGKTVTFSITEKDTANWKVTGVEADTVSQITTVSELHYSFVMPSNDVNLTVKTEAVKSYEVVKPEDVAKGKEVAYGLKLGNSQSKVDVDFEIRKNSAETKSMTINLASPKKVTFNEVGTYLIDLYDLDNDKVAVSALEVAVRDIVHGETIDDPLTPAEAKAIAHTLDITYKDGDWVYNPSPLEYYIQGRVDLDPFPDVSEQYHNATFTLEGDFVVHQTQSSTKDLYKSIEPGSLVTVKCHIINYGGKSTAKENGTPETYKNATDKVYPNIEAVVNDAAKYVKFDTKIVNVSCDDVATKTVAAPAKVYPTVLECKATYVSADPAVATVDEDGNVTGVSAGTTTITASYTGCPDATVQVKVVNGPAKDVWETDFAVTPVADIVLPSSGDTTEKYYIIGEITAISSTQYGNGTIVDKAGTECAIYGMYDYKGEKRYDAMDEKPGVGDVVVLYGKFTKYNNKPEIKNAWLMQNNGKVYEDPAATDFELNEETFNLYVGGSAKVEAVAKPDGSAIKGAVSFSSNSEAVTVDNQGNISAVSVTAGATITVTVEGLGSKTCTVVVTEAPADLKVDTIDSDFTGVAKPTGSDYAKYSDWSGKVGAQSGTTYAGNSATATATQNYALQLRWDTSKTDKRAGIWNSASVGKIKSITVTFDSNTSDSRELLVFGLESACTGTADTHITTDSDALVSLTKTSATYTFSSDFSFFALRSKTGAIYITSIQISCLLD